MMMMTPKSRATVLGDRLWQVLAFVRNIESVSGGAVMQVSDKFGQSVKQTDRIILRIVEMRSSVSTFLLPILSTPKFGLGLCWAAGRE